MEFGGGGAMWRASENAGPESQTRVSHLNNPFPHTEGSWEIPRAVWPRARGRPTGKGHMEEGTEPKQWAMVIIEKKSAEKPVSHEDEDRERVGGGYLPSTSHPLFPPCPAVASALSPPGKVECLSISPPPFIGLS